MLPCLLALLAAVPAAANDLEPLVQRFLSVYALVESEAADPPDPTRSFYEGAIPGMMRKLDPHSVFFDPGQFEQLRQLQTSTRKGFGSVVSVLPGRVIVLQSYPGTPSGRAGLSAGDEILSVNGYALGRLEMEQIVAVLSESRQAEAKLEVWRPSTSRLLPFTLVPEEMQAPSVERMFLLEPGYGYLRVSSFDEKTGEQIKEGIEKLGGASLKGLALDLRDNPGGVLGAALDTASLFLKPGSKLLVTRGRAAPEQEQKVPETAKPYTFRVAVLVNGKSASAAEIVAGALQDHDRGTIVGEPSYGKGLVERVYPLSEMTGLALTTALYYTPSGRSIQRPIADSGFALSATSTHPNAQKDFRTAGGRPVKGGGGVQPDAVVLPDVLTRLRAVLDASGSFINFATEFVSKNPKVQENFEVTPAMLDQFQAFLAQRNIHPSNADWVSERTFISLRLKAEIFNQALGVAKGDEVEAQRDPQIRKALEILKS